MDPAALVDVAREGMYLLVLLAGPPVGAAVVGGLAIAIVQTATQIQEQTLSFAVRTAAVVAALLAAGPWMGAQLMTFTQSVLQLVESIGLG